MIEGKRRKGARGFRKTCQRDPRSSKCSKIRKLKEGKKPGLRLKGDEKNMRKSLKDS